MQIARHHYRSTCRRNAVFFLAALVLSTLEGCGPVIETTARARQLPPVEGRSIERISILLDTSRLERTSDTLDPARLKVRLEEELESSGVFRQYRVEIEDVSADSGSVRATVALTRFEYTMHGTRFPPAPPLGFVCLYPLAAPVLFERDYLKMEAAVEAELLVYGPDGAVASRTYITESATGRANFFASGEKKAATVLQDIAFHNFSEQAVREFLFLTR